MKVGDKVIIIGPGYLNHAPEHVGEVGVITNIWSDDSIVVSTESMVRKFHNNVGLGFFRSQLVLEKQYLVSQLIKELE